MRSRRGSELVVLLVLAAIAAGAWLAVRGPHPGPPTPPPPRAGATAWSGLVGSSRPAVDLGDRMIVVLRTPSVAQRLGQAGFATESDERRWTAEAFAAQQQVLTQLARHGLATHPDYSYARVLDGFSAVLDPRALALLDVNPEVAGVYPVRAAYPATIRSVPAGGAGVPAPGLPGFDGTGITIALLDTGVELSHPYLGGRVRPGIDVVGGTATAAARRNPQDRSEVERHATELAGLLVGSGGPGGATGLAPGATVLPIRVAGWQPTAAGADAVYARSDQVIAGLERAVDPNGDGDTHDAVRIALLGVVEPFASFPDSPEAQAVAGALALDVLVVAPAGNDGVAGPLYGSIAGPGGSRAALTVGAADSRPATATVRVVLHRGLVVAADASLPLLGGPAPGTPLDLLLAAPGGGSRAGRAVLEPAGANPAAAVAAEARAGAAAVLLYGRTLPAGTLADAAVPVVGVPPATAGAALAALRQRLAIVATLGLAATAANPAAGQVAPFSSRGLTLGGLPAPQLTAPGIAIETSTAGGGDGEPAYTEATGTSVAAAAAAAAGALLAEARPGLSAAELASLLAGSARPPVASLDPGAAAVGEVAASTTALTFGPWNGPRFRQTTALTLRNVSSRWLAVAVSTGSAFVTAAPAGLVLPPGGEAAVRVTAAAGAAPALPVLGGELLVKPRGGQPLRLPWVIVFHAPSGPLVGPVRVAPAAFAPSDSNPAALDIVAGRIEPGTTVEIEGVARLDVLLYTGDGTFLGVLARDRDLLPGVYRFGLTGRGPDGTTLAPGRYQIRVNAWPVLGGGISRAQVGFRIE